MLILFDFWHAANNTVLLAAFDVRCQRMRIWHSFCVIWNEAVHQLFMAFRAFKKCLNCVYFILYSYYWYFVSSWNQTGDSHWNGFHCLWFLYSLFVMDVESELKLFGIFILIGLGWECPLYCNCQLPGDTSLEDRWMIVRYWKIGT